MPDLTRITPTGILVTDAEPETPEWFEARRRGITGTDLPKILGLSKWGNALSVWRKKRDELPEDDAGEAARWGQLLEDVVAQEWASRNETEVELVGVIANVDHPWRRASLDRIVIRCPDNPRGDKRSCGLEVKTRSAYKRGSFRDKEPDDVLAQVMWGLLVTGLDHMHIAVLIGGQELLSFRVDRDDVLEQYLIDAAYPVWQAVLEGDPPVVHPDAEGVLLAELDKLYAKREGEVDLSGNPEAQDYIDLYRSASALEAQAKRTKTRAKTALVQYLGDGDLATIDGRLAFTYRAPAPSEQVTAADLRLLRKEDPELYWELAEGHIISTTDPKPRFNLRGLTTKEE